METVKLNGKSVQVKRVVNDVNGNPRYVVHYLAISRDYGEALAKSRLIGGRKYMGKDFGGGIVFQSYSLEYDLKSVCTG